MLNDSHRSGGVASSPKVDASDVVYEDFCAVGRRLARELREEDNCDLIVAVTHSRLPNDELLAENVPEIDLILGGHDHDYVVKVVNGVQIVKSGTDFRDLTEISVTFGGAGTEPVFSTVRHSIVSELPV